MGYGRYLLFGSPVIALLIAVPVFLLIRLLVACYRESFSGWVAWWRASGYLREKRGVRLARRLFAGGEAKYTNGPRLAVRFATSEERC